MIKHIVHTVRKPGFDELHTLCGIHVPNLVKADRKDWMWLSEFERLGRFEQANLLKKSFLCGHCTEHEFMQLMILRHVEL